MARRPRRSDAPSPLEATQVLDPHAMDRTQVIDPQAMETTRILDPRALDATLVLQAPLAAGPVGLALAEAPARPEPAPALDLGEAAPARRPWKLAGLGAAVLVLGLGAWGLRPAGAPPVQAAVPAAQGGVPSGYEAVLAKAEAGDAHAMRTLATVYTYGLGTPSNRAEGLRWYHRAADAGSRVAREELKALEGR